MLVDALGFFELLFEYEDAAGGFDGGALIDEFAGAGGDAQCHGRLLGAGREERADDHADAARLARLAAAAGDASICTALIWLRERAGDACGAEAAARLAAAAGDAGSWALL
ncbi:hypothetical protein JK359_16220 [Streptomyces actinomycinicus]|uniref:Uncharacterized protein n=1 Tax=Streptomyces actinomycinicus TaxID=1695166 RepID=A0A937JMG4_9ACTN|nr:hypothetical protein [Streptomyces actinomycinicus]